MPKVVSPKPPSIPLQARDDRLRRIGYLWLPYWQTDRIVREACSGKPEAGSTGPIVTWVQDGSRMIVSAACARAERLGLRPGMKLAQAQAMIPDLAVIPARPQQDNEALAALAEWCRRYSPFTCPEPPDGIWLDLTGCTHLFGGEALLLADLAARIGRTGLSARTAIAATPGAAYAIARHGVHPFVQVPYDQTRAVLAPLPVVALRLDPEQTTLLHRFGLHTIGELDIVPRGPLTRRLGSMVTRRLDQAFGRSDEPIHPDLPAIPLQERLAFLEPLTTADSLQAANAVLAAALCRTLEAACLGVRRLDLVFIRLDGSSCVQTVTLARPSHAPRHIGRLLDERLEQVDPGEGIETMWLVARLAEPISADQSVLRTLAHNALKSEAEMLRDLAPLIDTLQNRLGAGRLWRPMPMESDVPERTVRRQPPLDMSSARPAQARLSEGPPSESRSSESWPASLPRPVRLIDPPQLISAMAGLPDHAPVAFTWRSRRHRVRHADGPERIAGEWWLRAGEMFAVRDYFRVEDEDGRRFWLFRRGDGTDLITGDLTWFLHGLF